MFTSESSHFYSSNTSPSRNAIIAITFVTSLFASQACLGSTVQSTTNYGMLTGTHVTYTKIRESTATETPPTSTTEATTKTAKAVTETTDPSTLYGTPNVVGNALFFDNPNFGALANADTSTDVTDGRLSFSLQSDAMMYINCLTLDEFGAVSLTSPAGTANTGTLVRIQAPAFLTVFDVMLDNGEIYTLPKSERLIAEMVVSPDESSASGGWHAADPDIGSYWEGQTTFDIPKMLAGEGVSGPVGRTIVGATRVEYDMNNILTAHANDGQSTAFIDKKGISVTPKMTPMTVPEPVTALLIFPCLLALGCVSRKRLR